MLQINTGKLYSRGVGTTNDLTGVLYTNARLPWREPIETVAGTLRSAGIDRGNLACVFDMEERIEAADEGPGVLVSHGVGPFLDDFILVATVGLGVIFARTPDKVLALTGGEAGFSSYRAPTEFIARLYDRNPFLQDEEIQAFQQFVADLLALDRKYYLGTMRAMRSFVAGLHRLQDDLGLAYALMVSAIESLAQDFDSHAPIWTDVDEVKRTAIDKVLDGHADDMAQAVRDAILSSEHVALSRRYRTFVLSHIGDDYFRQEGLAGPPAARHELEPALRQAYALRSAYIHQVRKLPDAIQIPHNHWEVARADRRPVLTFQGLYRLSRHVIRAFVAMGPKVPSELYDYRAEEAGIVIMEMAPQYWVGQPLADPAGALRRLEGQISLAASVLTRGSDAQLVDLRPVLADVERLLPQAPHSARPALLNLHFLFNLMVNPDLRSPNFDQFLETHGEEANQPGPISVIVSTILGGTGEWTVEDHLAALDAYFVESVRPRGLHAPRLFEAAACLDLAEKCRSLDQAELARTMIARAVETHPGLEALRLLERAFDPATEISWRDLLLPPENLEALTNGEGNSSP